MEPLEFVNPTTTIDQCNIALENDHSRFQALTASETRQQKVTCYVRKESGVVVAGILGSLQPGYLDIEEFWVYPPLRNRGIGTKILAMFEQRARELGVLEIQIKTRHEELQQFYLHRGYRLADKAAMRDYVLLIKTFAQF